MTKSLEIHKKQPNLGALICQHFRNFLICLILIELIFVAITIYNVYRDSKLTPVILTTDGPIQGRIRYSRDGQKYWQFLGIPYAMPPIGDLKFRPPVPIEPWENVKQVSEHPPKCAQYDALISWRLQGQMDCLYLNVYVNVASGNGSRPVLVWIHGGGFLAGGTKIYHPDYFMDQNIVLVVMQYRLGPYGFLNLENNGSDVAQGNMGLMDQNLVLKWIQKNIALFGGDPHKVTLFGESAGGVATHMHVLSPMSSGLFQRAVIQSGTALSPWAFSMTPRKIALEYAKKLGCSIEDDEDALLECFETLEWSKILKLQISFMEPLKSKDIFEPTVDGRFLREQPKDTLKSGNYHKIPVMFGVNAAEGDLRTGRFDAMPELIPEIDRKWEDVLGNILLLDNPVSSDVAMNIREKYFGNMTYLDDVESFKRNLTDLVSDSIFFWPLHKSATEHAKYEEPVYLYYFNYTSRFYPGINSLVRANRLDDWLPPEINILWSWVVDMIEDFVIGGRGSRPYGVSHSEDCFQLWNLEGISGWFHEMDMSFSREFVKTIVDFANATESLSFRNVTWPSVQEGLHDMNSEYEIPYMLLDNEDKPRVVPEPFGNRMKYWAGLNGRIH